MRKLLSDKHADMKMIGGVIGLFVTLLIAIIVLYSIAGSLAPNSLDSDYFGTKSSGGDGLGNEQFNQTPAENATSPILNQAETFFTIAPIIAIVVVAVIILGYVGSIGGGRQE